jgi:hypothetical protein
MDSRGSRIPTASVEGHGEAKTPCADFAHREQSFRSIVNAAIGDRERSEATLGATRRWGRTKRTAPPFCAEMPPLVSSVAQEVLGGDRPLE